MNIASNTLRLVRSASNLVSAYIEPLLTGDRSAARSFVENALKNDFGAEQLLSELVWPTMEQIQTRYKDDRINVSQLNLATRLNRFVADLLGSRLETAAPNGKNVLVFCGNAEPEELGGQITADLFQAAGYQVKFAGGGVPEDEILKLIGSERPDLLVLFGTLPSAVPGVRQLIDYLREMNCNPEMQIMCCGGIYKRAEGLAEEIGADLYAPDGASAVDVAIENPARRASTEQQTVGRLRRAKKTTSRKAPAATSDGTFGRIVPDTDLPRAEAM